MSFSISTRSLLSLLISTLTLLIIAIASNVQASHEQQQTISTDTPSLSTFPAIDDSPSYPLEFNNEDSESDTEPDKTLTYRSIKYSGKFHPVLVHFPIAFLLGAALMQWLFVMSKRQQIPPTVSAMLWMGTVGAILAAALGWAYAYDSMYFGEDEQILFLHRWLGTATATAAVIALILKYRVTFFSKPISLALLLTFLAVLVGAAAHYGGYLLYGVDNFTEF